MNVVTCSSHSNEVHRNEAVTRLSAKGVCWVCMEQLPRSKLGMVRTSKDEFESLEDEAQHSPTQSNTA